MYTLNTTEVHSVSYAISNARDLEISEGVATTLLPTPKTTERQIAAFRKTAHPSIRGGYQGWESTKVNDTLNVYDFTEMRTPTLIVEKKEKPLVAYTLQERAGKPRGGAKGH